MNDVHDRALFPCAREYVDCWKYSQKIGRPGEHTPECREQTGEKWTSIKPTK